MGRESQLQERILDSCGAIKEQLSRIAYAIEELVRTMKPKNYVACSGCGCRVNDNQDSQCAICGRLLKPELHRE
jgi:rubrerythrin